MGRLALPLDIAPTPRTPPTELQPELQPESELAAAVVGPLGKADWEQILRRHHGTVVLSLLAMGVRHDRALELAQTTWQRLMERYQKGSLKELKLPGLAVVQARFLALDEERRKRVENRHLAPLDTRAFGIADRAADPELRTLTKEQAERALAVIAAAPLSQQKLFKLIHADPQMPQADAARILGLSLQRVRQTLCELRKSVRRALEEDEEKVP